MIYEIVMHGGECDNCKESWESPEGYMAMLEGSSVREHMDDSGWHIAEDGKTYCPKCFTIGDDDEVEIKEDRKK